MLGEVENNLLTQPKYPATHLPCPSFPDKQVPHLSDEERVIFDFSVYGPVVEESHFRASNGIPPVNSILDKNKQF
jgi:hypothetical protein